VETVKSYLILALIIAIAIPGAVALFRDLQRDHTNRQIRIAAKRAAKAQTKARLALQTENRQPTKAGTIGTRSKRQSR
jgi:uncharacterized protein HemX